MAKQKSILIVEDEQELLDIISMVLRNKGYNVYTASNGKLALEIIETKGQELDLILSDIIMPQMSGIQLLDEIKKKLPFKPIVALTTGHTNTNIEDIYAKGAVNLLRKPFHLEDLTKMINEIFESQNAGDETKVKGKIELNFNNLNNPNIKLGQKGLFLKDYLNFTTNDIVELNITFNEGEIKNIKAIGEIVWVRSSKVDNLNAGTGVRFIRLSPDQEENLKRYSEKNLVISVIPKN